MFQGKLWYTCERKIYLRKIFFSWKAWGTYWPQQPVGAWPVLYDINFPLNYSERTQNPEGRFNWQNVEVSQRNHVQAGGGWGWRCGKVGPDYPVFSETFRRRLRPNNRRFLHSTHEHRRTTMCFGWYIYFYPITSFSFCITRYLFFC